MPMFDPSEWQLDDSQEPYAMPDGHEAKLRIVEVTKGTDKNGEQYFQPRLEIVGEPYSKDFTHFLHVPSRKMSDKKINQVRNAMKTFCECFDIDISRPFDPSDDWPGHEGWAILGVRDSEQYGEQNFIRKLIAGN
jgi:hypothetical protein